jgi:hypothetical protein
MTPGCDQTDIRLTPKVGYQIIQIQSLWCEASQKQFSPVISILPVW